MLTIIIPLFVAIVIIAYRYRETNQDSAYAPRWEHSTKLELLIWAVPLAIVIILGAMTWIETHTLDPYSKVTHYTNGNPIPEDVKPITINVVALNWKWLFLYPQYGIATVGKMAAPVKRPIDFNLVSIDVMNSFFIPALAGQIYAMPGMQTQLKAIIDEPGKYKGISANYSGRGFNSMNFSFVAMKKDQFQQWAQRIESGQGSLTRKKFLQLAEPSVGKTVKHYSSYAEGLFADVVKQCFMADFQCSGNKPLRKWTNHQGGEHQKAETNAGEEVASSASTH